MIEWAENLLWLWAGGILPMIAGSLMLDNDQPPERSIAVALLWPVFVAYSFYVSVNRN